MLTPMMLEDSFEKKMPNLDLVLYPISPTVCVPSTYPMLDSPDVVEDETADNDGVPGTIYQPTLRQWQ